MGLPSGEGALPPFHLEGGAEIVFQIGTAKYGVRGADGGLSDERLAEVASHEQVRMFEIKRRHDARSRSAKRPATRGQGRKGLRIRQDGKKRGWRDCALLRRPSTSPATALPLPSGR